MKTKLDIIKKIGMLFFIILIIILFDNYKLQDKSTQERQADTVVSLYNNDVVQHFRCNYKRVNAILVRFSTNNRSNQGELNVTLSDDKGKIQEWKIELSDLMDNAYHTFELNQSLDINAEYEMCFNLQVESEENTIAIYICNDEQEEGEYLVEQNNKQEGLSTDYVLQYRTLSVGIIVIQVFLLVVCGITLHLLSNGNNVISKIMVIGSLGFVYMMVVPMYTVPDETGHYARSYEISSGQLVTGHDENGGGVSVLPEGLMLSFYENKLAPIQNGMYAKEAYFIENRINTDVMINYSNPNQCLYSPFTYIPQAIGIILGRLVTDRSIIIFYIGRFVNFVIGLILLYYSMKWNLDYRNIIFLIAILPMFLHEMISYAADSTINVLVIFFVSYIYKLNRSEGAIKARECVAVFFLAVIIAMCKVVYFPIVLYVLCLNNDKFPKKKDAIGFKLTTVITSMALFIGWLRIAMTYLQIPRDGVNTPEQIQYVLTHMFEFVLTVANTTFGGLYTWIMQMGGYALGYFIVSIDNWIILFMLGFLVFHMVCYTDYTCTGYVDKRKRLITACIIIAVVALTYASLYVQWTPLKQKSIDGIQGRYFIPLLLPTALLIKRHRIEISSTRLYQLETVAVMVMQIMCICCIYQFYV